MKNICKIMMAAAFALAVSISASAGVAKTITIKKSELKDKIAGGWAGQTIGCAYGGPTEFQYRGVMIPDSRVIESSSSIRESRRIVRPSKGSVLPLFSLSSSSIR